MKKEEAVKEIQDAFDKHYAKVKEHYGHPISSECEIDVLNVIDKIYRGKK